MKEKFFLFLVGVIGIMVATTSFAQESELSLFEDIPIVVTSASGRPQEISEIANAMYVITKEDIARSGARNIPDLFYRVPGMQVVRFDGHQYCVAVRGAPTLITNNLLVLIDGAVVFNPSFNGVFWPSLPITLGEIERIEIIRGAAGVLYSSNAVNGVVNIITKKADAVGRTLSLAAGSQSFKRAAVGGNVVKEGRPLSVGGFYLYDYDEGFNNRRGDTVNDSAKHHVGGTRATYATDNSRMDVLLSANLSVLVDDGIRDLGVYNKNNTDVAMGVVQYSRTVSPAYSWQVHADHVSQTYTMETTSDWDSGVSSLSTQHNFSYALVGDHVLSLGAELRRNVVNMGENLVRNSENTQALVSYFLREEYRPTDTWIFVAGTRIDRNTNLPEQVDQTVFSPHVSALYRLTPQQSVLASVGRSYRTPSFTERDMTLPFVSGVTVAGDITIEPERVWTYQTGYRGEFYEGKLTFNADAYIADMYDPSIIGDLDVFTMQMTQYNNNRLRTFGAELYGRYAFSRSVSLTMDYTYAQAMAYHENDTTHLFKRLTYEVARHQAGIGVQYTNSPFTVDLYLKFVSKRNEPWHYSNVGTEVSAGQKIRAHVKTFFRAGYDFRLPGMKDPDAQLEFVCSDFIGAHVMESYKQYIREAEYTLGLKVRF